MDIIHLENQVSWHVSRASSPSKCLVVPEEIGLLKTADNPGLPPKKHLSTTEHSSNGVVNTTNGVGSKRVYLDIQRKGPYPPRPIPGSIMDLDIVSKHCDFYSKKVRPMVWHYSRVNNF